jgi:hypothetical protein
LIDLNFIVEAFSDEDKCSEPLTADGDACELIMSLTSNALPMPIENNPITDCNLSGADTDLCLDPSQVNGSECIWCDAGIGGFCFPKS